MELTKSEIEIADRWISKREKQLAQWPHRRWLIVAIFSVFTLLGYRSVNEGMGSIDDDKTAYSYVNSAIGEAPPPGLEQRWSVGTMLKIGKILELRQQIVAHALMQVALGYIEILSGVSMVCIVILRSRTRKRDALICKLLRGKLQEVEQVYGANTNAARSFSSS
jgi:hypothetical protein